MSINPILPTGTANAAAGTPSSSSSTSSASLGSKLNEQSFLTLLSAELKYQDPLSPMNNTQFVAELAQFSQLSAVTSQTSTLKQILSAVQGNSGDIMTASQLIGKTVTTTEGKSGQVTAVTNGSHGMSFDVSGVGPVQASDIAKVSES